MTTDIVNERGKQQLDDELIKQAQDNIKDRLENPPHELDEVN